MRKVLCVCQGNTCRSPMMERMLRHLLERQGITDVEVESAGLRESAAGQPMAEFSIKELEDRGISADGHVSRYIGTIDTASLSHILTVGQAEADQILSHPHFPVPVPVIVLNLARGGIPNPWEKGAEAYRECADLIEQRIEPFVRGIAAR